MRGTFFLTVVGLAASVANAMPGWTYSDGSDTTVFIENTASANALVVKGGGGIGVYVDQTNIGIRSAGASVGLQAEGAYYGVEASAWNGAGVKGMGYTGVWGQGGTALFGEGTNYGVLAEATASDGIGVKGTAHESDAFGVLGESTNGTGVKGVSGNGVGVYAEGYDNALLGVNTHNVQNTLGVKGVSTSGHGINGLGLIGVSGYSSGTINNIYGVYGNANGSGNPYGTYGVYGTAANGSNNWSGYFTGNVYVGGTFSNPSDEKFKKNVKPLNGALRTVMSLKPRTYDMKVNEFKGKVMLPEGNRYGLIAQELEKVLPDLVHKVSAPVELPKPGSEAAKNARTEPNTDFKSVDYISLIPILIGAIQELEAKVEALEKGR